MHSDPNPAPADPSWSAALYRFRACTLHVHGQGLQCRSIRRGRGSRPGTHSPGLSQATSAFHRSLPPRFPSLSQSLESWKCKTSPLQGSNRAFSVKVACPESRFAFAAFQKHQVHPRTPTPLACTAQEGKKKRSPMPGPKQAPAIAAWGAAGGGDPGKVTTIRRHRRFIPIPAAL